MDTANINDENISLAERCAILINMMKECNVGSIQYYVTGSGDSPDDSSMHFYDDPDAALDLGVGHGKEVNEAMQRARNAGLSEHVLQEFCWEVLCHHFNEGWYNDGGGYGYVWITAGEKPQVGAQLWEYPEPEADCTGTAVTFGVPEPLVS